MTRMGSDSSKGHGAEGVPQSQMVLFGRKGTSRAFLIRESKGKACHKWVKIYIKGSPRVFGSRNFSSGTNKN